MPAPLRPWMLAACAVVLSSALVACADTRPARMDDAVNTVRMGLEQYATDHGGRYPADAEFPAVLVEGKYVPLDLLPNPYAPGPCKLVAGTEAVGLAAGDDAPKGAMPGTIIYHWDAARQIYDVTAVIERQGRLEIANGDG